MTVKELITKLLEFDKDLVVAVPGLSPEFLTHFPLRQCKAEVINEYGDELVEYKNGFIKLNPDNKVIDVLLIDGEGAW